MKGIAGVVIAIATLALTTACQDGTTTRQSETTSTTPTPAAPGFTQPATGGPVSTQSATGGQVTKQPATGGQVSTPAVVGVPATAGNGTCVDPKSPVVTAALAEIGPSVAGATFVAYRSTEAPLGSCPALMWVLADTEGGTASSPWHVLLFDHAGFLGTATRKWTAYTSVAGSSDRSVQIEYRWLGHDDPSCCPTGGPMTVTLTLGADGHTVTPDRDIPTEVTDPH
ncbi:LppP/LprE family lipoprotein [Nocardia aurantia]|uniref:LppP/LprE family lipoprotein n=1 Tax=Nocardia aurantia TaxID=2585199 RepID=A0A7K0DTL5_9NOCA|nr:LppP/LprE family lipoprotein [Nocardia aurantia]MQY28928.1 hypothetical protein [Nocardia aurantia]